MYIQLPAFSPTKRFILWNGLLYLFLLCTPFNAHPKVSMLEEGVVCICLSLKTEGVVCMSLCLKTEGVVHMHLCLKTEGVVRMSA